MHIEECNERIVKHTEGIVLIKKVINYKTHYRFQKKPSINITQTSNILTTEQYSEIITKEITPRAGTSGISYKTTNEIIIYLFTRWSKLL